MTTLVFRQGGNNTRIGNTYVWAEKAKSWCDDHDFGFYFLPGESIFGEVFENTADFFKPRGVISSSEQFFNDIGMYSDLFGRISTTCSQTSSFKKGVLIEILPGCAAYVNMAGQTWDESLVIRLKKFSYVIVDEPFPFKTTEEIKNSSCLNIKNTVASLIKKNRNKNSVCVHVRQGDYARWQNGKYYKDDNFYNELISELIVLKKEGIISNVFVVHNGSFNLDEKNALNIDHPVIDRNYSDHIVDIITIACSGLVIGPFSTFSKFASRLSSLAGVTETKLLFFDESTSVEKLSGKVKDNLNCSKGKINK